MLRIISLGAGVQSTYLCLAAERGDFGRKPDCAIFADTKAEPKAVYDHLKWLIGVLSFPVHIVSAGDLIEDTRNRRKSTSGRVAAVPWHMKMPDGSRSLGRRQCTKEYKLRPVQRKIVELLGGRPKGGAEVWIGISTDEAARMKNSGVQYIVNRYPLIEARLSRFDCLARLERMGVKAPRSACVICPFLDDEQRRHHTANERELSIQVDRDIRHQPGFRGDQFMHRSLIPLEEVDLSTPEELGQFNLFNNECEGMCGV